VRRTLAVASLLTCVALLAHAGVGFWAANEFTQPESIVAGQSRMFAARGTLYYALTEYPYTVCAYMPVFYSMAAALHVAGVPILVATRTISLFALLGILWLVWRILLLYTRDRFCAWTGLVLAGSTQLLLSWGTVGQVDMLAVCFTLAGFYQYSRHRILGEPTVAWAALFALAALFTKQTAVAAPAAIATLLFLERPRKTIPFAAIVAGAGGAVVLGLDLLLQGRFLQNTVFANLNPFAWHKLQQHFDYAAVVFTPLLVAIGVGLWKGRREHMWAPLVYLGFASLVAWGTAGKIGSDSNYQIEWAVTLIICACVALHAVDFFPLFMSQSRSLLTLLVLPIGLYGVQNLRIATFALAERAARDSMFAQQVTALRPYLQGGRVLSADMNALLQGNRAIDVEPLIYRLLVEAGRIDGEPLRRDLAAGRFDTVILYDDLHIAGDPDPEIPRLPVTATEAIREAYGLVARVPGPYGNGVFVYQPERKEGGS
jgi:hypothetical protein